MAKQFSFDIVSQVNLQEVDNAVNQAKKELGTRYDFRGSKSSLEFLKQDKKIKLIADDDMKLRSLQDILRGRMAARKISAKAMKFSDPQKAFEGTLSQEVTLITGIPQEDAKEIVKSIKNTRLKVQAAIQDDQIRVTSKNKDDLQGVIGHLREHPPKIPLQFENYR